MYTAKEQTPEVAPGTLPSFGERYVPIQKLAEGGMAEVFLARDVSQVPPKLVVLKRILPAQAKNPEYLRMFHDEGRLASAMAHPNVVKVFEVSRSASGPFIVMEYLAGQDLFDLTRRARRNGSYVPWELAVSVAAEAAQGVAYAHQLRGPDGAPLNIIHRDLTPSNLFVTWDGLVKVLDFGIARANDRLAKTQVGMVKGKSQYLAPEQITGSAIDGRVDQFALAAVLFEMLCGRVMFHADNELAALNAILEGRRPSILDYRPDLPVEVDAVILRATSVDADRRFADMTEFSLALRSALGRPEISRESIAQPVRQLFAAEFAAHAELMGKLQTVSPDTDELRELYQHARAHDPVELPPLPTDLIDVKPLRDDATRPASLVPLVAVAGALVLALVVFVGVKHSRRPPVATAAHGVLTLRSDPPGAQVVLDGQPTAWTTPFVLDTVALGHHKVQMRYPARRPFETELELSAEHASTTVEAILPLVSGRLNLRVRPGGARVSLDHRELPLSEGAAQPELSAGEPHQLLVEAPGFAPKELSVEVKADAVESLEVALESMGGSSAQ